MLSANTRSSKSAGARPERSTTAATTGLASSIAGTLANVPLRAVPIGVRAAATIAARDVVVGMCLPRSSGVTGCLPDERGQSIPLNRYRYDRWTTTGAAGEGYQVCGRRARDDR